MTSISTDPKIGDVLSAILERADGFTGADIAAVTKRRAATIRFVLHQLWTSGWISGGVDALGNLPRPDERRYRITPEGHQHILQLAQAAPSKPKAPA